MNTYQKIYPTYRESAFSTRKFPHSLVETLIKRYQAHTHWQTDQIGTSEEGRNIWKISGGTGPIKIFLWSQMHGDEATATMAIFDLLNFLSSDQAIRQLNWPEVFSLHFVPMVNPDGASKWSRFNALGIDLNRDASAKQAVESQLLWKMKEQINPDYCLNLHDQDRFYTTGFSAHPATISFLANPCDFQRSTPAHRLESMQLISAMASALESIIPNQIGRYVADFDPSSFGDRFQETGSCTLLIESGAYLGDQHRMKAREYNFIAILTALESLSTKQHISFTQSDYEEIPQNKVRLFDIIARTATIQLEGRKLVMDLGINFDDPESRLVPKLHNFGDLSQFHGFQELDFSQKTILLPSQTPLKRMMPVPSEWGILELLAEKITT